MCLGFQQRASWCSFAAVENFDQALEVSGFNLKSARDLDWALVVKMAWQVFDVDRESVV